MRPIMCKNSVFYLNKNCEITIEQYRNEYNNFIKEREMQRIVFLHQSPQFYYRKYLVKHLKESCIEMGLTHCTLHLAIYLMDIFMDNHHIDIKRLLMVAHTCLILAAKIEENINNIPKLEDLRLTPQKEDKSYYIGLEIMILKFFSWNIMIPTPAHYIHYYIHAMVSDEDLREDENPRKLIFEIMHNIDKYLDEILDDIHYMQSYSPSKLALALIAASRIHAGLKFWNQNLSDFSQYSLEDIREPLEAVLLAMKHFNCIRCGSIRIDIDNSTLLMLQ